MRRYSIQFVECKKVGNLELGKFVSFKKYPELAPKSTRQELMNLKGSYFYECLKFGGRCSSSNPQCVEMRKNLPDKELEKYIKNS